MSATRRGALHDAPRPRPTPHLAAPPRRRPTRTLRILLADEHPLLRAGLRALIAPASDLELVAEADTPGEAAAAAPGLRPDVVVLDLAALGAVAATSRFAAPVLLVAQQDGDERVLAAVRAGARGAVSRSAEGAAVLRAIRAVAHGEAIFPPETADRLLAAFAGGQAPAAFPGLTPRELEVLERIARGLSTGQIARELVLSPKTIRNHVSALCTKLAVIDRVALALRAREAGLGRPDAD
jgi:DNA-binding NarL/FixJ family response regulator